VAAGRRLCRPRWRRPKLRADNPTTGRPVHDSVADLLADAVRIGDFIPDDARSSSHFERVSIDGEPCIVKYVHPDDDFALRAMGPAGRSVPLLAWRSGIMDLSPAHIDHATLGAAPWGRNGWGCALLMRDVGAELVPIGDDPIGEADHLALLRDLAGYSSASWGWVDDGTLLRPETRWEFFGPAALEAEEQLGDPEPVPRIAREGWQRFTERVPLEIAETVDSLRRDAAPLVHALSDTPWTLLHGDWKLGNLGRGSDGRTILIDWAYVGAGPVAHELGWYLALNRARLPRGHTKESTIADFEAALIDAGIDTSGWWDRQVELCLLGTIVQFGWEKALGSQEELAWWCDRAADGARWL